MCVLLLQRWRWEQARRAPEAEQLDQLVGSLAEAVKAVASFIRVSGVPDYREEVDGQLVYKVQLGNPAILQLPYCSALIPLRP